MSSNDMAVLGRYTQRFEREGTSVFIRTFDDATLVHEHECKNTPLVVPNEVHGIAETILAQLALGLVGSETNPTTGVIAILAGSKPGAFHLVVLPGNGVDSDYDKFEKAISTAGANGTIELIPGASYVTDRQITLLSGQRLLGFGATIKRAAQVISSTTTGITSGSTTKVTLPSGDGAKFKVGQQISVWNGADYGTKAVTITDITGDVVTTATSFYLSGGSPWSGNTTVASVFDTIWVPQDASVIDLAFNGNKSAWSLSRWEYVSEIGVVGSRALLRDIFIYDAPGEGVQEHSPNIETYAIDSPTYTNIIVKNANGNGVHMSGSKNPMLRGIRVVNANLTPVMGHADGGIILSNGVRDAVIDGFYVENAISGVASIDSSDNSDIFISNGRILNCTTSAIEGICPDGTGAKRVVISNLNISDSGVLQISQASGGSSEFPTSWILSNIYLRNTTIKLIRARRVEMSNVKLELADATSVGVVIENCKDVSFVSGGVIGGATGLTVTGSDNTTARVHIGGGVRFFDQKNKGVQLDNYLLTDVTCGSMVSAGPSSVSGWVGIAQYSNSVVQGALVRCTDSGHTGILQAGNNSIAINNTVRGTGAHSIRNYGGSTGNVALNNLIYQAVSNGGGAGNPNIANNTVI